MKNFLVFCVVVLMSFSVVKPTDTYGSVLFNKQTSCLSDNQKRLLYARMEVDKLLPKKNHESPLNSEIEFSTLLKYFSQILKNIGKMSHMKNKIIAEKAFYDVLGGYLKSILIPSVKISFYAGNVTLHTARQLLDLYEKCKTSLDTKGLGWKSPVQIPTPQVTSLYLNSMVGDCSNLILLDDEEGEFEDQIVALPRLEYDDSSNGFTNIWLPFRRKHVYNLRSKLSAFIFMRYFIDCVKCYETEKIPIDNFNKRFERWIEIHVIPHLKDEKLYAGLGGVLRVLKTLKERLNDTRPLIAVIPVENIRRHSNHVSLIHEKVREEDYDDYTFEGSGNVTTEKVIDKFSEPLFTKNMMWITIFSVTGVLLIVLVFVFMKRMLVRKQRDMRNIPLANPPSFHDTSKSSGKSRSGRSSKSYLARKPLPFTSSASSMASRPKDYVNPHHGAFVSYEIEDRKKNQRRNAFLTPLNKLSSSKEPNKSPNDTKNSSFKVTTDSSESEDEIFDPRNFIQTKDLTKEGEIAPHATKNETNLLKLSEKETSNEKSKQKKRNEKSTKNGEKKKKEVPPTKFTGIPPTKPINVKGTVDVKMFRGVKDDNSVLMKNSKKIKKTRSRSVENQKNNNDPTIIHKRYNLESSAWETVHD